MHDAHLAARMQRHSCGTDLSDEYTNSNYTHRLKGTSAKAKANAVFALPVYDIKGNIERYNVFNAVMVMRCSKE